MLNNSEPEDTMSDTEVAITDLDVPGEGGKTPGRHLLYSPSFSFRTPMWRTLGVLIGIALLVVLVLVSIPYIPKNKGRVPQTPLPPSAYSTLSLSVADGIGYAASKDGTVTAVRVSNGSLLWRHTLKEAVEESATVTNGVVYIASFTVAKNSLLLTLNALHTSNGSLLWSRTFPVNAPGLLPLTVIDQEIFISTDLDSLAVRVRDGSLLWHDIVRTGLIEAPVVFNGVVYVCTQDGVVNALRASDGTTLWQYKAKLSFGSSLPVVVDGIVYMLVGDGSIDAVHTSNGSLLWHDPAQYPFAGATAFVADGVMYVSTLDGSMYALRASDGRTLWHTSVHIPTVAPSMIVVDEVVYVGTQSGSAYALNASNGVLLWLHTDQRVSLATTTVANGMVYLVSLTGNTDRITALRASDGATRWHYAAPHAPSSSASWHPEVVDAIFLLALQDGSIIALHTSTGSSLWHYATA